MPDRDDHTPPEDGSTETAFPPDRVPERIGPYKILEKIGEGGMGVVYLAEQEAPLRRRVALKVIKPGMDSKQVLARFEAERQALALMNHPGVAKVFDAGSTPEGHPYFVMEHVAGIPITEYCDKHLLNNRQRLALFIQVCEAIQHAHQKGIIHRDIKPSNILVTVAEGNSQPKVIDFGVAKATLQHLTEQTLFTKQGVLIGTPEYMSPEQAEMSALDIDTRSDVYSLGVLLYELLTGALPLEPRVLRRAGLREMQRIIRETDPPKPSTRITILGELAGQAARSRVTDVLSLQRQLRGDLDWITLKALEKNRELRFASPIDLAADVQRYLGDEPVSVGPPSARYRLGKFVRRHRPQVAAAAFLGIAILGGVISTAIGFARALRAERVAHAEATHAAQEAERAERTKDLLVSVLRSPDPTVAHETLLPVREIFQRRAERVLPGLKDQPLVLAQMMDLIGLVDANLGSYDEAKRLLTDALSIRRQNLDRHDPVIADSLDSLGNLDMETGHPEAALEVYKEGLSIREAALGPDDPHISESLNSVGVALWNLERSKDARPFLERALDHRQRTLPADDLRIAEGHMNLANVLSELDLNSEALNHYQHALDMYERLDPYNPDCATVLDNLGVLKATSQGVDVALPLHEQSLTIRKKMLPPHHPDVAISLVNTANDLLELKRYAEARPYYEEAIGIYNARPELGRRNLGWVHGNLSGLLVATRQFQESERHLQQAREILVALDGVDSLDLADILEYRAGTLREAGRPGEAHKEAAEAKQIRAHRASRSNN